MSLFSTGHDVVDQVGSVHLEGNILPTSWFSTFVLESGKPDLNAIVVLSEIVYWHRPTVVRDEYSGQVVRVKKKFKSDFCSVLTRVFLINMASQNSKSKRHLIVSRNVGC